MENFDCDVFILGAGLAGNTLALQIKKKRPDAKIIIADRKQLPAMPGNGSVGESTVELASHYFANILGLKEHLEKEHLPKLGLRYFLESKNHADLEKRLEVGTNKFSYTPSYQLDRGILENHLWKTLSDLGVSYFPNSKVENLEINAGEHLVTLNLNGCESCEIKAKWFIDASGRGSYLKKKLDLTEKSTHQCSAAWWKLPGEFRIDDWAKSDLWGSRNGMENARWYSTNHLTGKGYWFWIIPLSAGYTSFGIVADTNIHPFKKYNKFENALNWLDEHEPKAAAICRQHADQMSDFGCLKNYSYGCKQVYSSDNWALTGEAGVFLDPFYSPGSDFIAISNTYITDLVTRSLGGEQVAARSRIYNALFLQLYSAAGHTFKDQYPIMGNPLAMPLKVFWDWSFYWSFMARLFFDGKLTDLSFISKVQGTLDKANMLNQTTQAALRGLSSLQRPFSHGGFLDLGKHCVLGEMNASLLKGIEQDATSEDVETRFKLGIDKLEIISNEIKKICADLDSQELMESTQNCELSAAVCSYYNDLQDCLSERRAY